MAQSQFGRSIDPDLLEHCKPYATKKKKIPHRLRDRFMEEFSSSAFQRIRCSALARRFRKRVISMLRPRLSIRQSLAGSENDCSAKKKKKLLRGFSSKRRLVTALLGLPPQTSTPQLRLFSLLFSPRSSSPNVPFSGYVLP